MALPVPFSLVYVSKGSEGFVPRNRESVNAAMSSGQLRVVRLLEMCRYTWDFKVAFNAVGPLGFTEWPPVVAFDRYRWY